MKAPIRVVIADDHPVVRNGVRLLLQAQPHMVLAGEVATGEELLELCMALKPDVALTDIVMSGALDGEQVTRLITAQAPLVKVIALSSYDRYYDIMRMIDAGAIGYLVKNASAEEYLEAIEHAAAGKVYYCRDVKQRLQAAGADARRLYRSVELNEKELQVLTLLCKGKSNAEVATELELSIRTIEGYRLRMLEKFNTNNILKVMFFAISTGLIRIDEVG